MPTYCLIFRGLLPGQAPESFTLALSELHTLPPQQLNMVLSGRGLVLAHGLTHKRALWLQARLLSNGCVCALEHDTTELTDRAENEARHRSIWMGFGVGLLLLVLALWLAASAYIRV